MIEFNYRNNSNNMVVLRCIGIESFYLERVLFPAEEIVLTVPEDSRVEVWGNELYGPKLAERIRITSQTQEHLFAA